MLTVALLCLCSLLCYVDLSVLSSFAIMSLRYLKDIVAEIQWSSCCHVAVMWLLVFGVIPRVVVTWFDLQYVNVTFPNHTSHA